MNRTASCDLQHNSAKHMTQHFMDACIKGVDTSNAPPIPSTNRFLALFHARGRTFLVFILAAIFLILSSILTSMLILLQCAGEHSFERLFLLSLRQLIGFNTDYLQNYGGPESAPLQCVGIAVSGDFLALLVQVVLVSILASCFLKTRVPLVMSERLLATKRDGTLILAFRIAHPQGHLTLNGDIKFVWVRPHNTAEGERHSKVIDLKTSTLYPMLSIPLTVTHVIDQSSPLFPYLDDLNNTPGHLHAVFTGGDFVLGCQTLGTAMYQFKDVLLHHRFADTPIANMEYGATKKHKVNFREFQLAQPQCSDGTIANLLDGQGTSYDKDAKQGLPLLQPLDMSSSLMSRQMLSNGDGLDMLAASSLQQNVLANLGELQDSVRQILERLSNPPIAEPQSLSTKQGRLVPLTLDRSSDAPLRSIREGGRCSEEPMMFEQIERKSGGGGAENGGRSMLHPCSESHHVPHIATYR